MLWPSLRKMPENPHLRNVILGTKSIRGRQYWVLDSNCRRPNIWLFDYSYNSLELVGMPKIEEVDDNYDLDAALDETPVSNFLPQEYETISSRELRNEIHSPDDSGFSFTNVAAFILSCCIAHFLLVTQGFLGKDGWSKLDNVAEKVQEFFTKGAIQLPEWVGIISRGY